MQGKAVAITGVGVVAPGAPDVEAFGELLRDGRTATRSISFFDPTPFRSQVAAECDFDPIRAKLSPQTVRRTDRATQLALAATRECVVSVGPGLDGVDPHRIGVVIGSAVGCTMGLEEEYVVTSDGGRQWLVDADYAPAHLFNYFVPSSIAAEVAGDVGAAGPVSLISTGCTSGLDAIGRAADLIRDGVADVVVAGATDAPISPITVACFDSLRATTPRNDDPATASRPFDRTRNGFVLGEGSAIFVLESVEHARRRGAAVRATVDGFGQRCNAYHMTGLSPDGREMSVAIDIALASACRAPTDVDYVNAHGSGTRQNDVHETSAVKRSLGDHARRIPMSSIKSMIGHSLGAIGSLEVAACVLALEGHFVPPTANLHEPDPTCDLDYVPLQARDVELRTVLSVGSGFGGFQSALVLSRLAATT